VKQFFTDESGASSVLIIFMMLVLVTLGAYSISSARINYVFSRKSMEWNKNYYECDLEAERFLMVLDKALADSEWVTVEGAFGRCTDVVNTINSISPENAEDELNRYFKSNVIEKLQALVEQYPNMKVQDEGPVVYMTISKDNSAIDLKIAVSPFRYTYETADNRVKAVLDDSLKRYSVLEWRQRQITVDDDMHRSLWDGAVE